MAVNLGHEHLSAAGIDPQAVSAAGKLGLSVGQILALVIKYGPVVLEILQEIAKKIGGGQPPALS